MPYRSKKQQRWAHATGQSFARKWDRETDFARLKDDAAPAHGPGGLLATPGLGMRRKKWGKALKAKQIAGNLYRGDNGKFQAGGASGPSTPAATPARHALPGDVLPAVKPLKQPKGGKRRGAVKPVAPKPTDAQRQAARDAQRTATDAAKRAQRDAILTDAGIDANTQGALTDAREGNTLTSANGAKLASMGLAEQGADGSYRLTAAGRSVVDAAMAGDAGRVKDTLSKAKDTAAKQPKTGGGGKGKAPKPAKQSLADRAMARRDENRAKVRQQMADSDQGIAPAGFDAFTAFTDGKPLAPDAAQSLSDMGLVEGTPPRLTAAGRGAQAAIDRGDYRDAVDAIGRAGQRVSDTASRNAARDARQADLAKRRADADARRAAREAQARENQYNQGIRVVKKSFIVYKDAKGQDRWLARTTTSYQDRDNEIIASAALDADSQRMMRTKQFGPLRWWHVGTPDPLSTDAPWGPGLDLGWCDYSVLIGRTRVESGTFASPAIAQKVARIADALEMSPGFFHPPDQPDGGVFSDMVTFERSLVPMRHARAANLFTGFTVKEHRMDPTEMERRFKAAIQELGLNAEQAGALGAQLVATEKAASQQGIAFKSQDAPAEITLNGVVYAVKAAAPAEAEVLAADTAAPVPPVATKAPEDMPLDDGMDDELEEEADVIGNLSVAEFETMIGTMIANALAPLVKTLDITGKMSGHMDELKSMMSGYSTKDDSRSVELTALKAQQTELAQRIAAIEGHQPAVILPTEVEAALKSAGPQTPPPADPNAVVVPNDPNRPFAGLAAVTFPDLYRYTENGWQPQ